MIKQSHDRISNKLKRIFMFRTTFFACVNHETVAVEQRRKCEMSFLRKRSKITTKLSQVHVDTIGKGTILRSEQGQYLRQSLQMRKRKFLIRKKNA